MAPVVAPAPEGLLPADFAQRAFAVALDTVIAYALLVGSVWLAALAPGSRPEQDETSVPAWVAGVGLALTVLYLAFSTARGATLGMRAAGLRVLTADGRPIGLPRASARSLLVAALYVALVSLNWWLLPLYGLAMFLTPSRRLPHDAVTGTRVVHASSVVAPTDPGAAAAVAQELDPTQARGLLDDMDRVGQRVRADARLSSVPLAALGLVAVGGALAVLPGEQPDLLSFVYWPVSAPVGLLATLLLLRGARRRAGVRPADGWLVALVAVTTAAAVVTWFTPFSAAVAGLAFLGLAVHERDGLVGVAAALSALVLGVEQATRFLSFSLVSNRFPGTGAEVVATAHGDSIVYALVGTALLGASVVVHRREPRPTGAAPA